MYRALYAHNSKLPKYLSFQAGDKFTLVDTSVSDQWFLAQNGLGEIGYVPFNYIKKVEATTEQMVKFIDGAMEAIHLQSASEGGQYTHEQRLIMKKLVKHRAEVIKSARGSDIRSSGRRRPAPAPPIEKSQIEEATTYANCSKSPQHEAGAKSHSRTSSGASGQDKDSQSQVSVSHTKQRVHESKPDVVESKSRAGSKSGDGPQLRTEDQYPANKSKTLGDPRRASALSEIVSKEPEELDDNMVRKSKSVTSSIGQAPSLVSSYSSNASEVTTATSGSVNDSSKVSSESNPFENENVEENICDESSAQTPVSESHDTTVNASTASCDTQSQAIKTNDVDYDDSKNPFEVGDETEIDQDEPVEDVHSEELSSEGNHILSKPRASTKGRAPSPPQTESQVDVSNPLQDTPNVSQSQGSTYTEDTIDGDENVSKQDSDSISNDIFSDAVNVSESTDQQDNDMTSESQSIDITGSMQKPLESPTDDLPPPPPPEVYDDINIEQYGEDTELPPAPPEISMEEDSVLKGDDLYVNLQPDIQELCGRPAMEECSCDNFQPKFNIKSEFFASNSLELPPERRVRVAQKEDNMSSEASKMFSSLLKCQGGGGPGNAPTPVRLLCLAQAHNVQVTHADCEEMIGEFRKVSGLSHEEGHWALLSAMSLLAAKVPHIKPSLEAVALRFNMAHQCQSTGKDYQSEDACTLDSLVSALAHVMGDAQQRGHYLRDDLDSIIDIVTGLTETLSNAKHCVSVAAIQKDDFCMVELIAKYYQMETRWVIHSCLLQLVETICRLESRAMQEFIYSELPQELVAEMQQHQNDDVRLMQVAKTLGVIFMKGQALPHKLRGTMDLHFFLWLLGVCEQMSESGRPADVDIFLALVCAYLLQYADNPSLGCYGDPLMDAFKMAQGHALLSASLSFLSKHEDPTNLLGTVVTPKVNSSLLLLLLLYDSPDTADLLYTNDSYTLVAIFEEFLRDLAPDDPMRLPMLQLVENFLRTYPDTMSLRSTLSTRIGPLLLNISQEGGSSGSHATRILGDNSTIFDDV